MKYHRNITFNKWLDEFGIRRLAKYLKVNGDTVRRWRRGDNDPRVDHMRRIKRLTKGEITYDMMIDRRPITSTGTYED